MDAPYWLTIHEREPIPAADRGHLQGGSTKHDAGPEQLPRLRRPNLLDDLAPQATELFQMALPRMWKYLEVLKPLTA